MSSAKPLKKSFRYFSFRDFPMKQRLPLLIFALLLSVIAGFGLVSYIGIKRAAVQIGKERLVTLTDQLSSMFGQSAQNIISATRNAASQEPVRKYLSNEKTTPDSAVLTILQKLRPDSTWVLAELLNANKLPVAQSLLPGRRIDLDRDSVISALSVGPDSCKSGRLYNIRDSIYYPVIAAIADKNRITGYLVRWRLQAATPNAVAQFSQLLGTNARLYIGNVDGSLWSDLRKPVQSPPGQTEFIAGFSEYSRPGGGSVIAKAQPVPNTQWLILIEFSQQIVLEAANRFLRLIIIIGAVFLAIGILIAWNISRNITAPLHKLTAAASAIAAGNYSQKVEVDRRDETGKLARAFNAMMAQVNHSQHVLEKKVLERTAQLESKIQQLKESEEKFQKAFQASAAAITITRLSDSTFADVNDAFIKMTGFSKEEIINRTSTEAGLVTDLEKREEVLQQIRETGAVKDFEMTIFDKSGKPLDVLVSLETIMLKGEKYLLSISYDITERRKAQMQLEAANKELEAFSYSVSHDLRAPLRIINGYTEILLSDYSAKLDDEAKRMLGIVAENVRKMGQLIDDLLNLSHLGRKELIVQKVDMTRLVENTIAEQPVSATGKYKITIEKLQQAVCDSSLIRQVWVNLISNAVKYSRTSEKPEIIISSSKTNGEVIYSIKDNGVGFNMKYADKLFGVFQRLHKMNEYEGTGVGLALVHRIITRHGGRVWAEAEVDKGATFYFSLPVLKETQNDRKGNSRYNQMKGNQ